MSNILTHLEVGPEAASLVMGFTGWHSTEQNDKLRTGKFQTTNRTDSVLTIVCFLRGAEDTKLVRLVVETPLLEDGVAFGLDAPATTGLGLVFDVVASMLFLVISAWAPLVGNEELWDMNLGLREKVPDFLLTVLLSLAVLLFTEVPDSGRSASCRERHRRENVKLIQNTKSCKKHYTFTGLDASSFGAFSLTLSVFSVDKSRLSGLFMSLELSTLTFSASILDSAATLKCSDAIQFKTSKIHTKQMYIRQRWRKRSKLRSKSLIKLKMDLLLLNSHPLFHLILRTKHCNIAMLVSMSTIIGKNETLQHSKLSSWLQLILR